MTTKKILMAILAVIASIVAFIVCFSVSSEYLARSAVHLVDFQAKILVLAVSALVSACVFYFIQQLRSGFYRYFWFFIFISYAAVLVYLLFMKNIGDQAFNISFTVLWMDFQQDHGRELLNNFLAFFPLPIVLWGLNIKPRFIYIAIGFVLLELAQFTFSLGAFDIGDLFAYFVAYCIGVLIVKLWAHIYGIIIKSSHS